jgi:hypothetical protein
MQASNPVLSNIQVPGSGVSAAGPDVKSHRIRVVSKSEGEPGEKGSCVSVMVAIPLPVKPDKMNATWSPVGSREPIRVEPGNTEKLKCMSNGDPTEDAGNVTGPPER